MSRTAGATPRHSPLRRAVLAAAVAAVGCRFCHQSLSFAAHSVAPVLERPERQRSDGPGTAVAEHPEPRTKTEEEEFRDRLKEHNLTLEFSYGEPDDILPGVTNGSPYVTCFVEYQDRSQRDSEGTVQASDVLEEWVMRGDQETVDRFTSWRQRSSDTMSLRCIQTASKSVEETMCLECVSHSPSMAVSGQVPGEMVGTVHSSLVMTFGVARHCLANTGGGPGFCKSGTVTVPHF